MPLVPACRRPTSRRPRGRRETRPRCVSSPASKVRRVSTLRSSSCSQSPPLVEPGSYWLSDHAPAVGREPRGVVKGVALRGERLELGPGAVGHHQPRRAPLVVPVGEQAVRGGRERAQAGHGEGPGQRDPERRRVAHQLVPAIVEAVGDERVSGHVEHVAGRGPDPRRGDGPEQLRVERSELAQPERSRLDAGAARSVEEEALAVGQEAREALRPDVAALRDPGRGLDRSAASRDRQQWADEARREENHVPCTPGASPRVQRRAGLGEDPRLAAEQLGHLEAVLREEADLAAVRRPERIARVGGAGQHLRLACRQGADPERRASVLAPGHEGELLPVGRERHAAHQARAVGRPDLELGVERRPTAAASRGEATPAAATRGGARPRGRRRPGARPRDRSGSGQRSFPPSSPSRPRPRRSRSARRRCRAAGSSGCARGSERGGGAAPREPTRAARFQSISCRSTDASTSLTVSPAKSGWPVSIS